MEFKTDGSFSSTRSDKPMYWTLSEDSTLHITKGKKQTFKKGTITSLSSNTFTFRYYNKKSNSYVLETYVHCDGNTANKDTRSLVKFTQINGIYLGVQQGGFFSTELGYTKTFYNSMNTRTNHVSLGAEFYPIQNIYGGVLSGFVHHNIFHLGLGVGAHLKDKTHQVSGRINVGVNGEFINEYGKNIMLFYSMNLPLSERTIPTVNTHSLTLRWHLPVSEKNKEKRINNKFIEEHQ